MSSVYVVWWIHRAYIDVTMHMIVDTLGVRHIFQHDIANLQGLFAEPDLEKLDRPYLVVISPDWVSSTYLLDRIVIFDREQARRKQDLKLLHDDVSSLVDADKGTDNVACFARAELYACQRSTREETVTRCCIHWLRLPALAARSTEILDIVCVSLVDLAIARTQFVLVLQFFAFNQGSHNTLDSIWSFTQISTDRIGNLVQENTRRIEDAHASDGRDVLGDHVLGLCSWMQESLDVPTVFRSQDQHYFTTPTTI